MDRSPQSHSGIVEAETIRKAIDVYLEQAYESDLPEAVQDRLPAENFDPSEWLMSDSVERTPADVPLEKVQVFDVRLGNMMYPHMKMRLARIPNKDVYVFLVHSHDEMLKAPEGSPDASALKQLKDFNTMMVQRITEAWEKAGIETERSYMRKHITNSRQKESND